MEEEALSRWVGVDGFRREKSELNLQGEKKGML